MIYYEIRKSTSDGDVLVDTVEDEASAIGMVNRLNLVAMVSGKVYVAYSRMVELE